MIGQSWKYFVSLAHPQSRDFGFLPSGLPPHTLSKTVTTILTMSQSQDSPAPRTFLQVFEDEGEESTAAYHAALIKAGKNLTKKLDHDEAEELSVAVENIQDSMTNWNARVQQYRGDIEELDVSHVRFKRTGVDQLGQQNEQLQAEVEHIGMYHFGGHDLNTHIFMQIQYLLKLRRRKA